MFFVPNKKCKLCIFVIWKLQTGKENHLQSGFSCFTTWFFACFTILLRVFCENRIKIYPSGRFLPIILIVILTKAKTISQRTKKNVSLKQLNIFCFLFVCLWDEMIDAVNIAHLMSTHSFKFSLIILRTFHPFFHVALFYLITHVAVVVFCCWKINCSRQPRTIQVPLRRF